MPIRPYQPRLGVTDTQAPNLQFRVFVLLFAASGFAGLIYESVWTHYLKLFLGHAAYSQTLVLAIFMGGLSVGAWLAGRYAGKFHNLLLAYALAETLIGLMGLGFHHLFTTAVEYSYSSVFPSLTAPWAIQCFKWGLAALLILPQSVLLGTTFPLMTAGVIRRIPGIAGYALALMYFANSLGAAIGVLVSGFVLIRWIGLPGTIVTAGIINLVVAIGVGLLARDHNVGSPSTSPADGGKRNRDPLYVGFLVAALLTGSASFLYEIGWVRMLSLVLGSSTHAFELMLGAFILGLALGGFAIRRHIGRLQRPVQVLGIIQVAMGCLALLSLLLYDQTFNVMRFVIRVLDKTDTGYALFNIFSNAIALSVMLPTTICAGMTLPLMTHYLVSRGSGEQAIGHVYAANTLGAILGVVIGVQFLMPGFGVKSLLAVGAGLDILLGGILLVVAVRYLSERRYLRLHAAAPAALAVLALLVGVVFFVPLDPIKMASGVFLQGRINTNRTILFHRDGKTASIDVVQNNRQRAILTNGKTDAAISEGMPPNKDEPTMMLASAIPLAMHPAPRTVGVIGMGSGLSTHIALADPGVTRVDTVEIEPAMVEGARLFGERVQRTFDDPRSHIHIEDAKAFFTHHRRTYDVIISEPSHPWVSGVAGLFSKEFYQHMGAHLEPGGLFVQWLHIYSIDVPLVASVIKAVSSEFDDYVIYTLSNANLAIIATNNGIVGPPSGRIFELPELRRELARIGVRNLQDLAHRRIGSKLAIEPFFSSYDVPANSDYFPVLDLGAVRARFLGKDAMELQRFRVVPAPVIEVLEQRVPRTEATSLSENHHLYTAQRARQAMAIYRYFDSIARPNDGDNLSLDDDTLELVRSILAVHPPCTPDHTQATWLPRLHRLADLILPYLTADELRVIWSGIKPSQCLSDPPKTVLRWLDLYQRIGERDLQGALDIAKLLLPAGQIKPSRRNNYLVTVALLRYIQADRVEAGKALWTRYTVPDPLPTELRLLRAMLDRG